MPLLIALVAAGLAAAGSHSGLDINGVPIFAACVGLAMLMQWLAFVPAYLRQTERFYDLTGSATFVVVMASAVWLSPADNARSYLLMALVAIWALRLGGHLFGRIRATGSDRRFTSIKTSVSRFLTAWTLQGLWVAFSLAPALAAVTSTQQSGIGWLAVVGISVWLLGFGIEVIADRQKNAFRLDPGNAGQFIHAGLWAWSRHPNYFGEILLWIGIALIAIPNLHGLQWITLLSPVFVAVLLTRISGIPILERSADERWGGRDDYETYKRRTPVLIPRPPR